jgi:hypothetical protein
LATGALIGIAQGDEYVLMLGPVGRDAVGMNLRTGDAHVDLHGDAEPALFRVTQHRNMTMADTVVRSPQLFAEFARPRLKGTGPRDMAEREGQRE